MESKLIPNKAEAEFLTLAYNRFYDIFEKVFDDTFWKKDEWARFSKIKEAFSIYSELLNYEPIKLAIEQLKTSRPPMEAEIGSELFKFRFWESNKKRMTYLSINFPQEYDNESKIYLKDLITEKEGIKFSFILMRKIIDTQVE